MKHLLTAGSMIAAVAACAQAEIVFDNFGPGDSYSLHMGATLSYGGPLGGDIYEAAVPFMVTGADYFLDLAEVAVLHSWGPDLVYADIHLDDNGVPGMVLESTTGTGVTEPFVWSPPMQIAFSGTLILQEGQQYWLSLRTEETDALLAWANNVTDDYGLRAWRYNYGPWQSWDGTYDHAPDDQRPVYRIHATLVPAPTAVTLLGLAGLYRPRRRA